MTYTEVKILESLIKNELSKRFPVSNTYVTSGDKPTIMLRFSLDKKSEWLNSDIENSTYFTFMVTSKGEVKCLVKSIDIKFEDFKIESSAKLLTVLIKTFDSIKAKKNTKILA